MNDFEFLLFSTDTTYISAAIAAGVDGIIIDREHIGKVSRQQDADTQISSDSYEDIARVRACTNTRILCRINNVVGIRQDEALRALDRGADEILLPMVRTVVEVEEMLDTLRGRAPLGILIETEAAVRIARDLATLPLSRVYVGLNDLAIERKLPNIFENIRNGTVEGVREHFRHIPFGFAGLTKASLGSPIPTRLLMGEMSRLGCQFTFLRRSFLRDVPLRDLTDALPQMRAALNATARRTPLKIEHDRQALYQSCSVALF